MLKRGWQIRISLAGKCQLLFGAAVIMILAAALFVPWLRMEQITGQLNERAARVMTEYAVAEHLAGAAGVAGVPDHIAVEPAELSITGGFASPRLILFASESEEIDLTPFEQRAIRRLRGHDRESIHTGYERDDGSSGFRYARIDTGCIQCHTTEAAAALDPDMPRIELTDQLLGIVAVDIPSQIETGQLLLNRVFILSAGLLAGTLAIIVFYLIVTRLILQPVRVLQETAQKVSEGDLNIRSDINTRDEFQQLSETFNQMLSNLKQSADQLQAANKSLDLKLNQLAETNRALYESNHLKSVFLANVSHELRTPLNSILGFAELLNDPAITSDPKGARYIQNILASAGNLLDLINDLLDLAKIEAGRMEVRSEPLSLGDLFEALTSVLKPLAQSKSVHIVATVAPEVPIIYTDPAKLQQILYNFLSNAIKFSPAGEHIDLVAELEDTGVRISVTDRGPGIPPDKHQIIFEKFRQIDTSVTRTHSGTGLGLAISRELTALLGGTIGMHSEIGAGSTFWVVLPLRHEAITQDIRAKLALTG